MTTRISSEVKAANELVSASDAAKGEASKKLIALFAHYNVPLEFDVEKAMGNMGALLRAIAADAHAKDVAHGGGTGDLRGLEATRKSNAHFVTDLLRSGRRNFSKRYGRDRAQVFTKAEPPTDSTELNHYADTVVTTLADKAKKWTARPHTVAPNIADYVAELTSVNQALKAALEDVQKAGGTQTSNLTVRRDAEADLHAGLKGQGLISAGFLEFAGSVARADQLRTHHHVGHPTTVTDPAVVDPNSKPKS